MVAVNLIRTLSFVIAVMTFTAVVLFVVVRMTMGSYLTLGMASAY